MPDPVFRLPDLGEGLPDAEIVAWHVAEGDHVVADQPLVSVETDKAVVEIPSPQAGRIARLLAPLHARVAIGAPLVAFAEGAEQDTGTVVGVVEPAEGALLHVMAGEGRAPSRVMAGEGRPSTTDGTAEVTARRGWPAFAGHDTGSAKPRAAPAVRALAASLRVDLAALTGSGPDGEITRADVQRDATGAPAPEPLTGVRRAMAQHMAEAGASVVPATVTDEADIDAWPPDSNITARLVAALLAGCRAEPALNARFDPAAMTRTPQSAVHVGLAVDTPDGLIVPVLRDAQTRGADDLKAELDRVETAVRSRRIAPEELRGATISLSNFGTLGGRFAVLVVVPPQVAILGAGRIAPRPVVDGDRIVAHRILPLSLTFDHRVVTGGEAARFLAAVKASLEAHSSGES